MLLSQLPLDLDLQSLHLSLAYLTPAMCMSVFIPPLSIRMLVAWDQLLQSDFIPPESHLINALQPRPLWYQGQGIRTSPCAFWVDTVN